MDRTAIDIASGMLQRGEVDEARRIAEEGIEGVGGENDTTGMWRLRFIRARALESHGQVAEALQYLESVSPPDAQDTESRAALKMYRGSYTGYLGRYEVSHRLFEEAETIARRAGLLELLGDIHLSRAFIYFRQKDYVSSDADFRAALELSENVGGWYLRGHGLWGIGKNLMIQEHYQEAMPWLEKSLEIFENAQAPLLVAMVWGELGVCYLGLGDDERAMELFRKAEDVNYEAGAVHNYQISLANIGNVYLHRCDHFTAISYYQRALAIAREIEDPVSVKKWTRNINLAYARIRRSVDEQNPRIA
ncbi:MAG TPA: tetratricopeptide repeat protein [Candidatus Sulfotelmatobacter sp.]